jgi:glutamine synthetase
VEHLALGEELILFKGAFLMDRKYLLARAKDDGVKFISFQFTDVTGTVKSVDTPVEQLEGALLNGIWFDG